MKKLLIVTTLLLCTILFVACSSGNESATNSQPATDQTTTGQATIEGQKVTLKIGHCEAEDGSLNKALVNFKNRVEAESNGNITVEIYPNGSLGNDAALVTAVSLGTLQMTFPATGNMASYSEKWGIFDIPYLFNSVDAAFLAIDGEMGQYLDKLLDGTGLLCLGYTYNGARCMTNNVRPINVPVDCKGIDFRIMDSPVYRTMFQCFGANPTPIAFSDVYTSLQNGVVDGEENPATTIYTMKFYEVQKYFSNTQHVYGFLPIIVSEAWYSSLDETNKAIIDKEIPVMIAEQRKTELDNNDHYIELMKDAGMKVNDITPENHQKFVDALKPLYDVYKEKFGQDVFDLAEKYNKEVSN